MAESVFIQLTVSSAADGQHAVLVHVAAITDIQPVEASTVIHLVNGRQLVVDESPMVIVRLLEQVGSRVARTPAPTAEPA